MPPYAMGTFLLLGETQFSTSTSMTLYLLFIASVIAMMGRLPGGDRMLSL